MTDDHFAMNHFSTRLGKAQHAQQCHCKQNQQGFSLLEMSIVVLILSIIAAIAMPNLASTDPVKLDIAAKTVATAIEFAQAESIRTKIPHGIFTDATNELISVYSLPGSSPVYNIYHPVDKKLYTIQLKTDAFVAGVNLVSANFAFVGPFSSPNNLDFNTEGYPKYSVPFGNDYMLTSGTITLSYQGRQRIVSIASSTGRVTIQ
jgi:prepilin-type N-terminal cleavage/methylation domain-containing protein